MPIYREELKKQLKLRNITSTAGLHCIVDIPLWLSPSFYYPLLLSHPFIPLPFCLHVHSYQLATNFTDTTERMNWDVYLGCIWILHDLIDHWKVREWGKHHCYWFQITEVSQNYLNEQSYIWDLGIHYIWNHALKRSITISASFILWSYFVRWGWLQWEQVPCLLQYSMTCFWCISV